MQLQTTHARKHWQAGKKCTILVQRVNFTGFTPRLATAAQKPRLRAPLVIRYLAGKLPLSEIQEATAS